VKIIEKLLKFSWVVWVVVIAITLGALFEIKANVSLETNLDEYMPENNPAFVYSSQAEDLFGIKDGIIVAIENPAGIYDQQTLQKIKDLTKELQKMDEIEKSDVTSLYTADNITGSDMGLEVTPFYIKVPTTAGKMMSLEQAVKSNDMINGRIVSLDGKSTIIIARIKKGVFNDDFYNRILDTVQKYEGPEKVYVAGRPIVEGTLARLMPRDMKVMAPLVILVIMIALLVILRSVKAMILNLAVVLLSTVWTFGLMALLHIPVYSVSTMIPVMLIAIGVAYGIHLFNHLYIFMKNNPGADKKSAVLNMIRYMWKPVMMAAVTTAVGFTSLLTSEVYPVKYFGVFTSFGVLSAFVLSMVLIPASLMITGLPKRHKPAAEDLDLEDKEQYQEKNTISYKFTRKILSHKVLVITTAVVLIAGSIFGLTRVRVDSSFLANFKEDSTIRVTDKFINEHFAGTSSFNVILEAKEDEAFKNPETLRLVSTIQEKLAVLPVVGDTFSLTDFIRRMNMVMNENKEEFNTIPESRDMIAQYLLLYEMSGDPETLNSVIDYDYRTMNLTVQLKSDDSKSMREVVSIIDGYRDTLDEYGIDVRYAGSGYKALVFSELILKGQVSSLGLSLLIVIILLTLMFKDIRLGLIGSIPVLFTALINFGAMGLLNIPLGPTTALISSIAVGIGIDYAIHFIENYREYSLIDADKLHVSQLAMAHSGRAILFNAVVVISGFLVFLFSIFPPNRQLGALVSLNMFTSFAGTLTLMFMLVYMTNIYFKKGDKK